MVHTLPDGRALPCSRGGPHPCRICALIDRAGPDYRPDYRRLFHPDEFPPDPAPAAEPESAPPAEPPGLVRKAINLGGAVAQHLAAGLPIADVATSRRRLEVCSACVQYDGSSCRLCGCHMPLKVVWLDQRCPLGLW